MDPTNYGALLPQLDLSPLVRGLELRQAKKERAEDRTFRQQRVDIEQGRYDAEQAKSAAVEGRKQQFMTRWKQVADAPTAQGYAALRADFPDQLATINEGQKPFDEQQRAMGRDVATGIHAHILGGDMTAALGAIDTGIQQFGQAGRPVASLQTLRGMLASGKPNQVEAAKRVSTMMLAQEAGDQYGSVFGALSREQQDADMMPDRMRRLDADADYAQTRAAYAPAQQQEQLRGRRVRTANTASLLTRREAPRLTANPRIGPGAPMGIGIRLGEQTATDGKGGVYVVRNGQWVKAR